jgi:hypothetical protein
MKTQNRLQIISAKALPGLRLELLFSDGKTQIVDFGPFLKSSKQPEIRKFAKPSAFSKFVVKDGDIMWGDFDLIFPIKDLYENNIARPEENDGKKVV